MAVIDLSLAQSSNAYSDGDDEGRLLQFFRDHGSDPIAIAEILANNPSWPLLYHLSPQRTNLLSWFPFKPKAHLLEVGAGCGALTGLFCEKVAEVTAVELTQRRAEIIFQRHEHHSNLKIVAGNLVDITFAEKFDYVCCIGVLEYAGRFGAGPDPYRGFLTLLANQLKSNGSLILAIENKFGLKYWSGVREDHTSRLFDSIEDYPLNPGVRTFGKPELKRLLTDVGFSNVEMYYPVPDYKLPVEIFSDQYLPSPHHGVHAGLLPSPDLAVQREYIFDERLAMENIVGNGLFDLFANSFLVICSR